VPLPKIERIYQPRGTLTEKDRPSGFDRRRIETIDVPTNVNEHSNGSVVRLTPKTDTRHVPSGPRDLKDYDQPAYLRRGIALPPIEEAESDERSFADAQVVMQESKPAQQEESRAKDRDDRPAFLKRIMD
jgi:hypothetical protein